MRSLQSIASELTGFSVEQHEDRRTVHIDADTSFSKIERVTTKLYSHCDTIRVGVFCREQSYLQQSSMLGGRDTQMESLQFREYFLRRGFIDETPREYREQWYKGAFSLRQDLASDADMVHPARFISSLYKHLRRRTESVTQRGSRSYAHVNPGDSRHASYLIVGVDNRPEHE